MPIITRTNERIRIQHGRGQPSELLYGVFHRGVVHVKRPDAQLTGCGQRLGLAPVTAAIAKVRCKPCLAYVEEYLARVLSESR